LLSLLCALIASIAVVVAVVPFVAFVASHVPVSVVAAWGHEVLREVEHSHCYNVTTV
jgi:hypothetical protein